MGTGNGGRHAGASSLRQLSPPISPRKRELQVPRQSRGGDTITPTNDDRRVGETSVTVLLTQIPHLLGVELTPELPVTPQRQLPTRVYKMLTPVLLSVNPLHHPECLPPEGIFSGAARALQTVIIPSPARVTGLELGVGTSQLLHLR